MSESNIQKDAFKYLTFTLSNQCYAVPIQSVREINQMVEITHVPQSSKSVVGVLNLRGKIIPVMDLRIKLNLTVSEYTKNTCIIIMENSSEQVGMIVDSVNEVIEFTTDQIEKRPSLGAEKKSDYIKGLAKLEEKVIILLDFELTLEQEKPSSEKKAEQNDDVVFFDTKKEAV